VRDRIQTGGHLRDSILSAACVPIKFWQSDRRTHLKPRIGFFCRVRGFCYLTSNLSISRILLVTVVFAPRSIRFESSHSVLPCGHSHPLPACQRHSLLSRRSPPVQIRSRILSEATGLSSNPLLCSEERRALTRHTGVLLQFLGGPTAPL
jgi:hypothetical protein